MNKPRIYFTYHHIEAPQGGANSFMRALNKAIAKTGEFEIMKYPDPDCDILFMVQRRPGPALRDIYIIDYEKVKKILKSKTRLIVRAVNLRRNTVGFKLRDLRKFYRHFITDRNQMELLHMADHVIFQSNWQKEMFSQYGYKGTSWTVIHNGADDVFSPPETPPQPPQTNGILRVLSTGTSANENKQHPLMVKLSQSGGVEMHYAGNWPEKLNPGKIQMHGKIPHNELANLWKTMHYSFHPAYSDPCPNAVCEALASGVPVIYNPKPGGTVELASPSGIALNESNLQATVQEARSNYGTAAAKARENWKYYTIDRACREYIEVIRRYS